MVPESPVCVKFGAKLPITPFFVHSKLTSRQRWDCFRFADNPSGMPNAPCSWLSECYVLLSQTGARLPDSRHSGVDTLYMCMEFWLRGLVVSPVSVRLCACKHTVLVKCICPKWRWVPSR